MLSLLNNKRYISIGIVLAVITFILVLYISFSTNNYYTVLQKFQSYDNEPGSHVTLIRVLCLILTSPKNFLTRTKAVNETWAPRCDRYFFITEYTRETMTKEQVGFAEQVPIASINNITAGYDHLTQKSVLGFLFAYENYFNDFEWFLKADDDTFLIVENLKAFLSEQNALEPITFGYNFKVIIDDSSSMR